MSQAIVSADRLPAGYDRRIDRIVDDAVAAAHDRILAALPHSAEAVLAWAHAVTGGAGLKAYFQHPLALPTLLFPWWLEESYGGQPDRAFHVELAYSSINGYLAIRLCDDVMDDDARAQPRLLPATMVFQSEFESVYRRHFPSQHPFWRDFDEHWVATADVAMADAALETVDADRFRAIAAAKVRAGLIPLAAVARRATGEPVPEAWDELFRQLSEWHQLRNDFFDWRRDLERGAGSYVLTEATRLAAPGESVPRWMAREGVAWGLATLRDRLDALRLAAVAVDASGAVAYLAKRQVELDAIGAATGDGLHALGRLLAR